MVDEAEYEERWKSENKRDEGARVLFKAMKEEIDFYPVQKIVKEQRSNKEPTFLFPLSTIFSTLRQISRAQLADLA